MGRREDQETRPIELADVVLDEATYETDPPTAITRLSDIVPPSAATADSWTITVLNGASAGLVLAISGEPLVIGRSVDADRRIEDKGMSRRHGSFEQRGGELFYTDLNSTNGSFLDGAPIEGQVKLTDGAKLQVGRTVMRAHLRSRQEVEAVQRLYESSVRDPLTGLYNRRHLDERMVTELAYAVRHRTPLACLVLDIDHFKRVNDTYGHVAGDAVLRAVAEFIQGALRAEDLVARYGEELVILLRGIPAPGAASLAERIRAGVGALRTTFGDQTISITCSIGVASWQPDRPYADAQALFDAADKCLYRAKEEGRDRVISDR